MCVGVYFKVRGRERARERDGEGERGRAGTVKVREVGSERKRKRES